jgi:hypothetical protein
MPPAFLGGLGPWQVLTCSRHCGQTPRQNSLSVAAPQGSLGVLINLPWALRVEVLGRHRQHRCPPSFQCRCCSEALFYCCGADHDAGGAHFYLRRRWALGPPQKSKWKLNIFRRTVPARTTAFTDIMSYSFESKPLFFLAVAKEAPNGFFELQKPEKEAKAFCPGLRRHCGKGRGLLGADSHARRF